MAYEAEYRLKNRNGHYLWVHDRGKVCERDQNGHVTHVIGMVRNISDQKNLQLQLETLANIDVLTELPNRRQGELYAEQALAYASKYSTQVAFAVIDLDYFKAINDLYGHQKGDEVLAFVAQLLMESIPETCHLYRWGGEEFVLIMPDTDIEQAQQRLQTLHLALRTADWSDLDVEPLTLSAGISAFPGQGEDFETLIKLADQAVYQAKSDGRNRTVLAANA